MNTACILMFSTSIWEMPRSKKNTVICDLIWSIVLPSLKIQFTSPQTHNLLGLFYIKEGWLLSEKDFAGVQIWPPTLNTKIVWFEHSLFWKYVIIDLSWGQIKSVIWLAVVYTFSCTQIAVFVQVQPNNTCWWSSLLHRDEEGGLCTGTS